MPGKRLCQSLSLITTRRMLTDGRFTARSTILSRDFQKTVCVHLKGGDQLGLSTGHWGNTSKFKFSKKPVVTALGTFTLVADKLCAMSAKKI